MAEFLLLVRAPYNGIKPYDRFTKKQGVYLIQDPDDRPIYVGRTYDGIKEKGLADRIHTHADGRRSNALDNLSKRRANPQLSCTHFQNHTVRVILIDDPHIRATVEPYCIYELKPEAN